MGEMQAPPFARFDELMKILNDAHDTVIKASYYDEEYDIPTTTLRGALIELRNALDREDVKL